MLGLIWATPLLAFTVNLSLLDELEPPDGLVELEEVVPQGATCPVLIKYFSLIRS